jgi:hypothetical protein
MATHRIKPRGLFPTVFTRLAALAVLFLLSACGDLPRPFEGNPGANAMRLVQPPPARLAVERPTNALLPDAASQSFADSMAQALAHLDVPAISTTPSPGDWRLLISASLENGEVIPLYTLIDEKGRQAGLAQGQPVGPAAWSQAAPTTLTAAAGSAAVDIAALLTRIEAARNANDPNSLVNRAARLLVPDVKGAPGDGNTQLAKQMRSQLGLLGLVVQNTKADFSVAGEVRAVPIAGNMTRIEIQWVVSDARGDERGRIVQLNEVPSGSLDHFWGDVALVVAQEAADGVKDVIARQTGSAAK